MTTIAAMWTKMIYTAENVFDLVKSYIKALINDPKTFVSEHTIVTILFMLVLIFILVLFINICRNIRELRIEKQRISEELKKSMDSISEGPNDSLDSIDKSAAAFYDALEKKIQDEVEKGNKKVEDNPKIEAPVEQRVTYAEPPKTVYVEQRPIYVEPPMYPQYREYVKEPIQVEVIKPIPVQEIKTEPKEEVVKPQNTPVKEKVTTSNKNDKLDYIEAFKNREQLDSREATDNSYMPFDAIPELQVLERENTSTIEDIIKADSKPIVMEKIGVVKVNPAKKFGVDNMDTNRQGKTFSYEELSELIKD